MQNKLTYEQTFAARQVSISTMASNSNNLNPRSTEEAQLQGDLSERDTNLEKRLDDPDTLDNVEPTLENYAAIMATNRPNPRGPGYIRLYLLAATIFLCATMSGQY